MLFNSYQFILAFLPIALIGYQLAGFIHRKAVIVWLAAVSLAFYAYWRPELLYILVSSIALNYLAAGLISRRIPNKLSSGTWLTIAIALNISALCYFKYLFPALNVLSSFMGSSKHWADVVLPLGISFFTLTQIAFLVDLHQGIAKHQDLSSYVLFVTFFPHLIAGPILHHKEMMPQFQRTRYRLNMSDLAVGSSWFIMGLVKKVLLADHFSPIANPVFDSRTPLSAASAWVGSLAYCLQLYFDFSGYSDMALGLARIFSINFPLNFNSPFKSSSIIDFWQRWHMTLSQYIMAYLFTPLQRWMRARRERAGKGVSRKDLATPTGFATMLAAPMMITLLIAGVWHGAGFQYVMYGLLHGSYLTVNHAWRIWRHKRTASPEPSGHLLQASLVHASSVLITFLCVMVSFVFFRSRSVGHAVSILAAMVGARRSAAPFALPSLALPRIALGFLIVWFLPNTQQILSGFKPSIQEVAWNPGEVFRRFLWKPDVGWALALGILFMTVLFEMQDPSTFLYFQF